MGVVKSTKSDKLSLNEQFDYVTLRFPAGNFTRSRRGYSASRISKDEFDNLVGYVESLRETMTFREIFDTLLDPKILKKCVPSWNTSPVVSKTKFVVGQRVRVNFKNVTNSTKSIPELKRFYGVRGKIEGSVVRVAIKRVTIRTVSGILVSMPKEWLEVVK